MKAKQKNKSKPKKRSNHFAVIIVIVIILASVMLIVASLFVTQNANAQLTVQADLTITAQPWTPDTDSALRNDLQAYYSALISDAYFYQAQLVTRVREEAINCDLSMLENPTEYHLSAMWNVCPHFVNIVASLNDILKQVSVVSFEIDSSCSSGVPIPRERILELGAIIIEVQHDLVMLDDEMYAVGVEFTEPLFPTLTPRP